jgi:2-methylisocitrate lyase-like PEP mutase family enzyme
VNVLGPMLKGVTLAQLAEAGVRRVSTGGALARAALSALLRAGTEMRDRGGFGWMSDLAPGLDVQKFFGPRPS